MDRLDEIKAALAAMLIPFIAERTRLSSDEIENVLEAEMEFWQAHPNGVKFLFSESCDDERDE